MKNMLSVQDGGPVQSRIDWYWDQFGWVCRARPDEDREPVRACPDAARVDLVLGGPGRIGALDLPALVGVAALERISRRPAAAGPVLDGLGRMCFLVDLGESAALDTGPVELWRGAGIEVRLRDQGDLPLPAAGWGGPQAVVWAVPPVPEQPALPAAELVLSYLDRAVRDAYPALWEVVRRTSHSEC